MSQERKKKTRNFYLKHLFGQKYSFFTCGHTNTFTNIFVCVYSMCVWSANGGIASSQHQVNNNGLQYKPITQMLQPFHFIFYNQHLCRFCVESWNTNKNTGTKHHYQQHHHDHHCCYYGCSTTDRHWSLVDGFLIFLSSYFINLLKNRFF